MSLTLRCLDTGVCRGTANFGDVCRHVCEVCNCSLKSRDSLSAHSRLSKLSLTPCHVSRVTCLVSVCHLLTSHSVSRPLDPLSTLDRRRSSLDETQPSAARRSTEIRELLVLRHLGTYVLRRTVRHDPRVRATTSF